MPNPNGPARHAASNNYTFAYVRCETPAGWPDSSANAKWGIVYALLVENHIILLQVNCFQYRGYSANSAQRPMISSRACCLVCNSSRTG